MKENLKKLLKGKSAAFTLAEALITIGIIGVVAAILMTTLFSEISEKVNSTREANIAQKITKSIELMVAKGDFTRFDDTIDFVNALSKYLKMSKICDSDHIADCWPTKEIITANGDKFEVKNAKTGNDLFTGYTSNNAAFVMADGASIIMSYDPSANLPTMRTYKPKTKTLPVGGGKFNDFAYTTEITDGIDFVMDVNGAEGPNSETEISGAYHDIRSFRKAAFSRMAASSASEPVCTYNTTGVCIHLLTGYGPLDCSDSRYSEFCAGIDRNIFSYIAGARKGCKDLGMKLADMNVSQNLLMSTPDAPDGIYLTTTNYGGTGLWVARKNGTTATVGAINNGNGYYPALCLINE